MLRFAKTPLLAFLACASAAGCVDTSNDSLVLEYQTLLTVDPNLFRGALPCGAPGLARFVATLDDLSVNVNPDTIPVEYLRLPSSAPTRCNSVASFGDSKNDKGVTAGHYYRGFIKGYDRDDIVPLETGSSIMVASDTGETVAERWTTTCGEIQREPGDDGGDSPDALPPYNPLRSATLALSTTEVILRGCLALAPVVPAADAGTGTAVIEEPQNSGKSSR